MRLFVLVVALIFGALTSTAWADSHEPYIADSPENIRPLMIGATVPDVALVTPDHRPVELKEALAKQPTVLIYYRGGW